jgi:arylsulfatase A-like enzyme/beta-glucanase (GH16 family)
MKFLLLSFFCVIISISTAYFDATSITSKRHDQELKKVQKKPSPNIIVILADDLGYMDVGFNGSKDIPTPNIDRIASEGVKFTNAYVSYPVCGPSRAGIITGRYQDRFGFGRNPLLAPKDTSEGLPLTEETMATVLGKVGYKSMAIGKWHLGAHRSQWPLNRGFDEFFGFLSGGHQYFPDLWTLDDLSQVKEQWDGYRTKLLRNNERVEEKEYLTDALSREAVKFIDNEGGKSPLFMYLAYNAPHSPLQATEKYLKRFSHIKDEKRRIYAAMVSAVDDGVGLLLEKLKEKNIDNNTLIFFLSDNGGPEKDNGSDNGPLRQGKGSLYEGGIRVPFAMRWPGKIPAGSVYQKPIISLDIMSTVSVLSGSSTKNPLDGVNLIPYLTGEKQSNPHSELFWRKFDQDWYAVVSENYKMLRKGVDKVEWYNLYEDLGEQKQITQKDVKNAAEIMTSHYRWVSEIKDPVFFGLSQNAQYNAKHPSRFNFPSPFKADYASPNIPEGYKLAWSEEFNISGKPNENKWSYEDGFVRNQELQWYQSDNASVKNGVLEIEGRREKLVNTTYKRNSESWQETRKYASYTSASIHTKNKFSFEYGIMEVRAKIDTSMGTWPAIWTLGNGRRWPDKGEIDIMEFYRDEDVAKILANAAWGGNKNSEPTWNSKKIPLKSFIEKDALWQKKFHIWKMVWNQNLIQLYLDEALINEIDVNKITYSDGFNPFRQPHYIILNLALGSNGGNPEKTLFPVRFEVDYVRIYQKKQTIKP